MPRFTQRVRDRRRGLRQLGHPVNIDMTCDSVESTWLVSQCDAETSWHTGDINALMPSTANFVRTKSIHRLNASVDIEGPDTTCMGAFGLAAAPIPALRPKKEASP